MKLITTKWSLFVRLFCNKGVLFRINEFAKYNAKENSCVCLCVCLCLFSCLSQSLCLLNFHILHWKSIFSKRERDWDYTRQRASLLLWSDDIWCECRTLLFIPIFSGDFAFSHSESGEGILRVYNNTLWMTLILQSIVMVLAKSTWSHSAIMPCNV